MAATGVLAKRKARALARALKAVNGLAPRLSYSFRLNEKKAMQSRELYETQAMEALADWLQGLIKHLFNLDSDEDVQVFIKGKIEDQLLLPVMPKKRGPYKKRKDALHTNEDAVVPDEPVRGDSR